MCVVNSIYRYDPVIGHHFMIDYDTGEQVRVEKNGEPIKQFSLDLTGKSSF